MASDHCTQLFVSHAYPEDNVFAGWLSDRLNVEGYDTWIDLRALKGGERIWPEVERAVREKAFRFLYVLSSTSNAKDGTLQELELARKVASLNGHEDFVIPLVIDDLRPAEFNIRLTQLRPIDFSKGWGSGFADLLAKLDSVDTPKTVSPETAAHSWRARVSGADRLRYTPERLYSNLFSFRRVPRRMFAFSIPQGSYIDELAGEAAHPLVRSGDQIFSFESDPSRIHRLLEGCTMTPVETVLARPREDPGRAHFDAFVALVRASWEVALTRRGLALYEMANKRKCFFFPKDLAPDRVAFSTQDVASRRSLTGVSRGAFWHYGVTAYIRAYQGLHLALSSHVVFSDDGATPWQSHELLHKARRRIGRHWWNDKWRDLLLAATSWLANGSDVIGFDVSSAERLEVSAIPLTLEAPFRYEHGTPSSDETHVEEEGELDPDVPEGCDDDGDHVEV